MIRTFINKRSNWNELIQINTETGTLKKYEQDAEIGFTFGIYETNLKNWGFKSFEDYYNTNIKSRKLYTETDTGEQIKSEIEGLLNLAKYRLEHNTYTVLELENGDYYDDIVERLGSYGIEPVQAKEMIISRCGGVK